MIEFKVSDYITLKLENTHTELYVNGVLFMTCKSLLLSIPTSHQLSRHRPNPDLDKIQSIDEASETLGSDERQYYIPSKAEFWGHCSNLQVWYEHDYDTRLLHSSLAFPLLKELTDSGDPKAKKIFKEEIAKRVQSGYIPVIEYLDEEGYLDYLNKEELTSTLLDSDSVFFEKVLVKSRKGGKDGLFLKNLFKRIGDKLPYLMNSVIKRILKRKNLDYFKGIVMLKWLDFLESNELKSLFKDYYNDIDFYDFLNYKYSGGAYMLYIIYSYTDDGFFLEILKTQPIEAIIKFKDAIINLEKLVFTYFRKDIVFRKRLKNILDLIQLKFKSIFPEKPKRNEKPKITKLYPWE